MRILATSCILAAICQTSLARSSQDGAIRDSMIALLEEINSVTEDLKSTASTFGAYRATVRALVNTVEQNDKGRAVQLAKITAQEAQVITAYQRSRFGRGRRSIPDEPKGRARRSITGRIRVGRVKNKLASAKTGVRVTARDAARINGQVNGLVTSFTGAQQRGGGEIAKRSAQLDMFERNQFTIVHRLTGRRPTFTPPPAPAMSRATNARQLAADSAAYKKHVDDINRMAAQG